MRDRRIPSALLVALVALVLAVAAAGCGARGDGPPPIRAGTACARCGMGIEDLKFPATRRVETKWLAYDAIECLIADRARLEGGPAWLTDYETKALLPEDSAWVLHGDFPSPMGGGLAAFADRAVAESLAVVVNGRVTRLAELGPAGSTP